MDSVATMAGSKPAAASAASQEPKNSGVCRRRPFSPLPPEDAKENRIESTTHNVGRLKAYPEVRVTGREDAS